MSSLSRSNYEVAELTWENGQLAMHALNGTLPGATPSKPSYGRAGDTLESIVHQATCQKHSENLMKLEKNEPNRVSTNTPANTTRKWGESSAGKVPIAPAPGFGKKRMRSSESDECGTYLSRSSQLYDQEECAGAGAGAGAGAAAVERSACASASAAFGREKDTTMMTWASSYESPGSLKTKTTDDQDSAYSHGGSEKNRDEEHETKLGAARSSRSAAVHNQSERRRRDRINQKMKALQKLVPNASKTDKASMLDEVIDYLKQLQAQIHLMSTRGMPQTMMNPLAMQQQLQMSLLTRMGMGVGLGMGMGMIDMNTMARLQPHLSVQPLMQTTPISPHTPAFMPPAFLVPPTVSRANPEATGNSSVPFRDPYSTYLAQHSANVEFYKKMAALYRQQASQTGQSTTSNLQTLSQGNDKNVFPFQ